LSLAFGVLAALAILFSIVSSARAQAAACETREKPQVPGAAEQDEYCLANLTTKGLVEGVHTSRDDWEGLHAVETVNPPGNGSGTPDRRLLPRRLQHQLQQLRRVR
jgi:hypothetical protein